MALCFFAYSSTLPKRGNRQRKAPNRPMTNRDKGAIIGRRDRRGSINEFIKKIIVHAPGCDFHVSVQKGEWFYGQGSAGLADMDKMSERKTDHPAFEVATGGRSGDSLAAKVIQSGM